MSTERQIRELYRAAIRAAHAAITEAKEASAVFDQGDLADTSLRAHGQRFRRSMAVAEDALQLMMAHLAFGEGQP